LTTRRDEGPANGFNPQVSKMIREVLWLDSIDVCVQVGANIWQPSPPIEWPSKRFQNNGKGSSGGGEAARHQPPPTF
jgi:hypothetical protein